jgi:hypothetical protein
MTAAGLPDNSTPILCSQHGKELEMFCTDCEVFICSKCVTGDHKGHNADDVDEAYEKYKVRY